MSSYHLQREIERLSQRILTVGTLVEESLKKALKSLTDRDVDLAREVVASDKKIDLMEVEVEEDCLKVLALHQPVAADLRFIVSVLKINNDLERIGDLARNFAERVIPISRQPTILVPPEIPTMGRKALEMTKNCLDALVQRNADLARQVCQDDEAVDNLHKKMYEIVSRRILEHPDEAAQHIGLLGFSRYLERIADHATNIAEDVLYMVEGEIQRHVH